MPDNNFLDFMRSGNYIGIYPNSINTPRLAMTKSSDKIRAKMERAQAEALREARRVQALASQLSKAVRAEDTHLKVLEGVTAMYGCEHSEEYRKMHEHFRARALFLPKDRAVFGLPFLSDAEVERRMGTSRKGRRKKNADADASASRSDSSASSSAIEAQKAPGATQRETEAA